MKAILSCLLAISVSSADLQFVGTIGNSGAEFATAPASGMGPIVDAEGAIWERGGDGQLIRYSPDGRLLASHRIPKGNHRLRDQLALAGDQILMLIGKLIHRLDGESLGPADAMSAGSHESRVVILHGGQLLWLDASSGERSPILAADPAPRQLALDGARIYGFGDRQVYAWEDGAPVPGFPLPFNGSRPCKLGDHWYAHAYHSSIYRYNARFEPDPGVVLGGASGSFIGYLPESPDIGHGTGLAQLRDDLFAVSGLDGVVQLLEWQPQAERLVPVRRLGAVLSPLGLAIDPAGNIWTSHGAWRWEAESATPAALGDVPPQAIAQPVAMGDQLVLLKSHYGHAQLARGPIFDGDGLAHYHTQGITGIDPKTLVGAAPIDERWLMLVDREGRFFRFDLHRRQAQPEEREPVPSCTSLAWHNGQLLAPSERYVHSDGKRLASAWPDGRVSVHEGAAEIASYAGLDRPTHIAIASDRLVVFESGKQRLVKLELRAAEFARPAREVAPAAEFAFSDADFLDIGRPGGIPIAIAVSDSLVAVRAPGEVTIGVGEHFTQGRQIARPPGDFRFAAFVKLTNQQERFGFTDGQPIHAPFAANSASWAPFDLTSYQQRIRERKSQIRLRFKQPMTGRASLVIEDTTGRRIRNLVSGRRFAVGAQTVIWDGLDDSGKLVPPGDYRWRGIAHPGIEPEFRMQFAGGHEPVNARPWGPNHGVLHDVVANDQHIFFAAPVTEGGWGIMALDPDGRFVQGYELQHGRGIGHNAIAVDARYLYCAQDGYSWGQHGGETWDLTVTRYDIASGKARNFFQVDSAPAGGDFNLTGIAVEEGRVLVGSRHKNAIFVCDPETGTVLERRPFADFARPWIPHGHQLQHPETGRILGKPGGPYVGAYDPARMVNPAAAAIGPRGKLWVAERRWNPKRILAWDLDSERVVYEKFGIPHYGGASSGFDPENPRRWIGLGCLWDIDLTAKSAQPTHILALDEGHFKHYHPMGYSVFREDGRTFLYARGMIALILELFEDGSTRPIVAAAGTHHFAYGCGWNPPQAYIDAFYAKWPEKRKDEKPGGRKGEGKPWAGRVGGVLWVDRNGDGETQAAEFDFSEEGVQFGDAAWGHRQNSLTLRFPVAVDGQVKIVSIAPDYPSLNAAIAAGTDISMIPGYKRNGVSTAGDRFGRFVFNSDPELNAYDADGAHLWSYPNQWSDVHGSHKAPLPQTGVLQGSLAILGMAALDDQADVFFLNGNHGRCFLLSSDGIYLDEVFTDVRVSYLKNEYRLGGEIFGGMFDRAADGRYFVQIGHGPYRIYQLHGLERIQRLAGELTVTPAQIEAAEQASRRQLAAANSAKQLLLPGEISWSQSGKFKISLSANFAKGELALTWQVNDPSPWVNGGRDWTSLFATGDSVDLQIGPAGERRAAIEGDQRLLIAPFEGQPIAVLYQHVKPGGANPIEFTSPWRGCKVDHVQRLDIPIDFSKRHGGYEISVRIPLAMLGLQPGALRADFGVTFGDAEGSETQLRSYWANPATMLVDDIPGEIMLHPNLWGQLTAE
jgi:hypothetical protein